MKYFIFLISVLCLFQKDSTGQSAISLRDGIEISLENSSLLYIGGDLSANDSGDSSRVYNNGTIQIEGDWNNNGSGNLLVDSVGAVNLTGSALQEIRGSSVFNDLTLDNASGATILSGVNRIDNTLNLSNGVLTTNDSLTLHSDARRTASIPEITGGSISGDVIIERYIDSTDYDYRFLSMPIQGGTLNDWYDDFIMTGFTGSQFPSFSFNSVTFYDESVIGNNDTGFVAATNITNAVEMGVGVQVYTGGNGFVVDVKGEIYSGDQDLPVTFTDDPTQSDETEDGWNLVGNPYPSEIDWQASSGWTKTNIDDAIYIYDGTNDQYASFVEGAGINEGSRYIASGQSFYVKATGANPVLRISEGAKTNQNQDFIERKAKPNLLKLRLKGSSGKDETIIRFHSNASFSFDSKYDAFKFGGGSKVPFIASYGDTILYSIQSIPDSIFGKEIPLLLTVPSSGTYELEVDALPTNDISCLFLHDTYTGRIENLRDSNSFHFQLYDTTTTARFKLGYAPIITSKLQEATCFNQLSSLILNSNDSNWINYSWVNPNGVEVLDSLRYSDTLKIEAGFHNFKINKLGCSQQDLKISVENTDTIHTSISTTLDSISRKSNAAVSYSGGTAPYEVTWSNPNQQLGDSLFQLNNGIYVVTVTDANNCSVKDSVLVNNTIVNLKKNLTKDLVSVYPNPILDHFTIEQTAFSTNADIEIMDSNGKLVATERIYQQKTRVDVQHLAKGIYFLRYRNNEQESIIKLQKIQ